MRPDDRGTGTVLAAAICLSLASVAWAAAVAVAWFGQARAASDAADLAALAAANALSEGDQACRAAQAAADRNDSELVACLVRGDGRAFVVEVSVVVPLQPTLPAGPRQVQRTAAAGTG